jgi:hypothetical protein
MATDTDLTDSVKHIGARAVLKHSDQAPEAPPNDCGGKEQDAAGEAGFARRQHLHGCLSSRTGLPLLVCAAVSLARLTFVSPHTPAGKEVQQSYSELDERERPSKFVKESTGAQERRETLSQVCPPRGGGELELQVLASVLGVCPGDSRPES